MNNEMLRLVKQAEDLKVALQQLAEKDTLTLIDRDLLKHKCLLMYEQLLAAPLKEQEAPLAQEKTEIPLPVIKPIVEAVAIKPAVVEPIIEPIAAQVVVEPVVVEPTVTPTEKPEFTFPPIIQQPLFEESLTLNDLAKAADTPVVKQPPTETELLNTTIDTILEQQQEQKIKTAPDPEITLHEKIANAIEPRENLIAKLSASIPSLKNAINVNLKIALVNQLFNENTVEYVKAIDRLNSCENIHEAMRYFNELKHQYAWDSENHNVRELEQLLTKRYPN